MALLFTSQAKFQTQGSGIIEAPASTSPPGEFRGDVEPAENSRLPGSFEPIFIVGAGRSGTTLLAVLFDRHSRVAVPPETRFFFEYIPDMWPDGHEGSREELVDRALAHSATGALGLGREELLAHFSSYPNTFPSLFRAMIELYASKQGKKRPGEKSPRHLEYVPLLLKEFPSAKVICIVRDGRDVVSSAMRTSWREGDHRRFYIFCADWARSAKLAMKWEREYGPERFTIVKYFDLLTDPETTLRRLCDFVGEQFEPTQIDPSRSTGVVLKDPVDLTLKKKALGELDTSRVQAWRRELGQREIWAMNALMGSMLRRFGYADTSLAGAPWRLRLWWGLIRIIYSQPVKPVASIIWRAIKPLFNLHRLAVSVSLVDFGGP